MNLKTVIRNPNISKVLIRSFLIVYFIKIVNLNFLILSVGL